MTAPAPGPVSSRPHWGGRTETKLNLWVMRFFRRLGWRERIEPFVGYGAAPGTHTGTCPEQKYLSKTQGEETTPTGWVRVLARVMVAPKKRGLKPHTSAFGVGDAPRSVRGWRSFFSAQAPLVTVTVVVEGKPYEATSDSGGYIDVVLPSQLGSGWQEVSLITGEGMSAAAGIQVLDSHQKIGLLSDIDDTALVTSVPRPLLALWNTFILHESARAAVPGMAKLYRKLQHQYPDLPMFYLSTGPWNVVPALLRFFAFHRFPSGTLLMTDFGPTNTGWFRSGKEHKLRSLARLAQDFPKIKWILIGDDGQHDPAIYDEFSGSHPENVEGIAIRQLTPTESILAHGPIRELDPQRPERTLNPALSFNICGADGVEITAKLRGVGILPNT